MKRTSKRMAFTLVEMLIVLFIIVAVAGIFIPVILNLTDRNQVAKGASMLENALHVAKTKAAAEKRPYGIRLLAAANNLRQTASIPPIGMAWYNQLQFIENPPDYNDRWVWSSIGTTATPLIIPFWNSRFSDSTSSPVGFDTIGQPNLSTLASLPLIKATTQAYFNANYGVNYNFRQHILFSPIVTSTGWVGQSGVTHFSAATNFQYDEGSPNVVFDGDYIEVDGTGELYKIIEARAGTFLLPIAGAPAPNARVSYLIVDHPLLNDVVTPLNGKTNYRIIRSPRVVASLPTIDLPQDVVIDVNPSFLVAGVKTSTDTSNTIYMSGIGNGNAPPSAIGSGILTTEISGLTTAAANQTAPLFIDILFSPTGEILQTSQSGGIVGQNASFAVGASGLVSLWLHQRGDPNNWAARQITAAQGDADNQALVCVNGRTGFIGSYPVDRNSGDPLANARIGKARISADTGP